MRVSLIGCGKVGITILYYLKKNNEVVGVHDPDPKAQARALRIRQRLATGVMLVHFSGLLPAEILPAADKVLRAAVHPFASFPRLVIPPARRAYPLFVQADAKAMAMVRRLFDGPHFIIHPVARGDKPNLHLMGVMSSNLLVSLIDAVMSLAPNGLERRHFYRRAIRPLIDETLSNLDRCWFRDALSGPVKRGDLRTVLEHLRRLRKDPELSLIYRALSLRVVKFAPLKKKKALKGLLFKADDRSITR